MPAPDKIAVVVKEWTTKGESDFIAAEHLVSTGDNRAIDAICFHAQ